MSVPPEPAPAPALSDTTQLNRGIPSGQVSSVNDALFSVALNHVWSWFSQHANQRMQALNHYLVAAAFLTAGYASAAVADRWPLAGVVSATGVIVSLAFNRLDARTRELVQAAEPALALLQRALVAAGYSGLDMLAASSRQARSAPSYRTVIATLTILGVVAFAFGLITALVKA
ncbi:MAG TPA: hypothetical protein VGB75_06230 [Jatrophihabitans sp.]|jgi:hypothetical protein|uniref:hypothetical protein n=1 Tax=Jatrophihabitans sp. TaxID=1932789 RepID=UPI002F0303D4